MQVRVDHLWIFLKCLLLLRVLAILLLELEASDVMHGETMSDEVDLRVLRLS